MTAAARAGLVALLLFLAGCGGATRPSGPSLEILARFPNEGLHVRAQIIGNGSFPLGTFLLKPEGSDHLSLAAFGAGFPSLSNISLLDDSVWSAALSGDSKGFATLGWDSDEEAAVLEWIGIDDLNAINRTRLSVHAGESPGWVSYVVTDSGSRFFGYSTWLANESGTHLRVGNLSPLGEWTEEIVHASNSSLGEVTVSLSPEGSLVVVTSESFGQDKILVFEQSKNWAHQLFETEEFGNVESATPFFHDGVLSVVYFVRSGPCTAFGIFVVTFGDPTSRVRLSPDLCVGNRGRVDWQPMFRAFPLLAADGLCVVAPFVHRDSREIRSSIFSLDGVNWKDSGSFVSYGFPTPGTLDGKAVLSYISQDAKEIVVARPTSLA